jgi:rod shape-determining protein MreD
MPAAIIFGVCVAIAAAAQTSLRPYLAISDIAPNIVIVFVACVALVRGPLTGCGLGLLGGFFLGSLDGTSLGQPIAAGMVVGYATGILGGKVFTERRSVSLLVGFAAAVAAEVVAGIVAPPAPLVRWLQVVALEAIYSAMLALPLYVFVQWINRLLPGPRDEEL